MGIRAVIPPTRALLRALVCALVCALTVQGCALGSPQYIRPETARPVPREELPTQAAYVELLGNGVLATVNYEVIIDGLITARLGGLCLPSRQIACPFVAPIMVGYLLGTGPNRLELGAGALLVWNTPMQGWTVGQTATIALRHQPERAGLMYKVGWTPIMALGPAQNESAPFWLGLAGGYTW